MKKVVIIGGGPAGRLITHVLHKSPQEFDVTLIKDEETNVNRCAVPYGISDKKPAEKFYISNQLITDFGAKLVLDDVQKIDTNGQSVTTRSGQTFNYDDLVIATGSQPIIPPIPNIDLNNIVNVRSKTDMEQMRGFAKKYKKCVVVGGGYIGIEVAVVMKKLGIEVTVVEMQPHVLQTTMDDDFAETIEAHIIDNGVKVYNNTQVTAFEGRDGDVTGVVLDNGNVLPTDFVIVSVGVKPNTALAEKSGIATSKFGIVTNEHMETNVKNIYSAGDCAEKKSFVTGAPSLGEFGTNAVFMAKVIAANILGTPTVFPGIINANASSAFEYTFGSAGLIAKAAEREGLDYVTGASEVMDMYPMMDGVSMIKTKLVFAKGSRKLLGGSVLRKGHCTAANVDFISFAIQMGATIDDILKYQYATHPELAAKPSDNTYMFAAQDALKKL
ncbi:NADH dehydrogenase [Desulfuromusa kysingii]|uniref:NADH dehydrogenase n=1 Tax=Desulfuromusa kysingii TaxID=37625 RepID=A0A1H4C8G7_9BACT|nr:FAD-dependent oxidoreductase [Desulfuromusa kysingii]SEA56636.1 NADH dehydrogenase [Desulfuromusa kysingii]